MQSYEKSAEPPISYTETKETGERRGETGGDWERRGETGRREEIVLHKKMVTLEPITVRFDFYIVINQKLVYFYFYISANLIIVSQIKN